MREELALTRDKILSYSLTAPMIDNIRAGPEVAGAATATGAEAAMSQKLHTKNVQPLLSHDPLKAPPF